MYLYKTVSGCALCVFCKTNSCVLKFEKESVLFFFGCWWCEQKSETRNYNFLKLATQNVAGDMLVSKSGFEPRGTESRRSTTPSHGNMRLRLSGTETLKRVLVVPPTKIRIWT